MGDFLVELLDRYFGCKPDAVLLVLVIAYLFYVMCAIALCMFGR